MRFFLNNCLTRLLMGSMRTATITELLKLKPLRRRFLILRRRVIAAFAFSAFKSNYISHGSFSNLFYNLRNSAGAHCLAALTDC